MGSKLPARPLSSSVLVCGGHRLRLSRRTHLMGILNLTPDSFSDGGQLPTVAAAYKRAWAMVEAGADLLDLGAESTRPGAQPVSARDEKKRLLPALRRIASLKIPISVDTCKPEVAEAALDAGACMINDITGLADPAMRRLAATRKTPVVIMHMQGTPQTMQRAPRYRDVVAEVESWLLDRARLAQADGVARHRIILDPGIGFGKNLDHNLKLLQQLPRLAAHGYPVLLGPSRKGFISKILGPLPPAERIWGTAAAVAWAVTAGVQIVRVHDVAEMRMVATVAHAIREGKAA